MCSAPARARPAIRATARRVRPSRRRTPTSPLPVSGQCLRHLARQRAAEQRRELGRGDEVAARLRQGAELRPAFAAVVAQPRLVQRHRHETVETEPAAQPRRWPRQWRRDRAADTCRPAGLHCRIVGSHVRRFVGSPRGAGHRRRPSHRPGDRARSRGARPRHRAALPPGIGRIVGHLRGTGALGGAAEPLLPILADEAACRALVPAGRARSAAWMRWSTTPRASATTMRRASDRPDGRALARQHRRAGAAGARAASSTCCGRCERLRGQPARPGSSPTRIPTISRTRCRGGAAIGHVMLAQACAAVRVPGVAPA